MIVTKVVVVVVENHTDGVLRKLTCHVPFGGIGSLKLADAVTPGEGPITRQLNASEPIKLSADGHELRERVVFTFSLNGVTWSRRPAGTEAVREELTAAP
jgi:hypothetical protein